MWRDDPVLAGQLPEPDREVRFLLDSGRMAEAVAVFDRIAAHPRQVAPGRNPAVVLVHRALLALRLGRMPLAIELALEGWAETDVERPHGVGSAHAISMFGYLLEAVGSYASGLELLTLAVRTARETAEQDAVAVCLLREANARLVRAFYADDQAGLATVRELCEEGLALASPGQTRRRLLNASTAALVGLDELDEAECRAEQAMEASEGAGDLYCLSYANCVFAQIRWRQDRLHEARTFAGRAVAQVLRTGEVRLLSLWAQTLAAICRELDDPAGEAAALRHAITAGRTTLRVLQEGIGEALEHRRLALRARREEASARSAAHSDRLTGLLNRRGLERDAAPLLQQSAEGSCVPWLLLVDIDHFKDVNDRVGHLAGDQALLEVAQLLLRESRAEALASRWAGDEFVVVVLACGEDAARPVGTTLAERVRRAIAAHDWQLRSAASRTLTVSIGVATASAELETLLAGADHALYRAKRSGRNRVETEHSPPS